MVEPSEELRYGVTGFRTYTGYLDVWIVDYIKAARELQLALYNQTNIEIDPTTHVSAIDLAKRSSSYESSYDDPTTEEYYYEEEEETTRKPLFSWEQPTLSRPDFGSIFQTDATTEYEYSEDYSDDSSYYEEETYEQVTQPYVDSTQSETTVYGY